MHGKIYKGNIIAISLEYKPQRVMKHLNYLTDHILYQIFKIISRILLKNMKQQLRIR